MLDLFYPLRSLIRPRLISVEGRILRLHSRVTVLFLVACCILVTSTQFFGSSINCMTSGKDQIPEDVLNNYCWVQSTFNSPSLYGKTVGVEVAHQGVGLSSNEEDVRYYKYYQWVCFVLFFQTVLFYAPHYLWKFMENGTIEHILLKLDDPMLDAEVKKTNQGLLTDYLKRTINRHTAYAFSYFFCELLSFVNVVGQIYFVDRFVGGEFTTYGPRVLEFMESDQDERFDPMIRIFPRVTKCLFHKYGPSGEIEKHAALCVLPLNIINEKIYVFMWFWFVILAAVTGLLLIHRIVSLIFRKIRVYTLHMNCRLINVDDATYIVENSGIGDWLLLYFLGKNLESTNFVNVIKILRSKLETRTNSKSDTEQYALV